MTSCACTGIRTCIKCNRENDTKIPLQFEYHKFRNIEDQIFYLYCVNCCKAFRIQELPDITTDQCTADDQCNNTCTHCDGDESVDINGISLYPQFIQRDRESQLIDVIDETSWVESQSGRKKQDYGPKVNFKKRKIKPDGFQGLPSYCYDLVLGIKQRAEDFRPVEMCCLDYRSEWGSSIDPHYDDKWIWGERLITLNLLNTTYHSLIQDGQPNIEVLVKLDPRSLIVCQGDARHTWRHGIRRQLLADRRVAMTFRELPATYLEGGTEWSAGKVLLDLSTANWNQQGLLV